MGTGVVSILLHNLPYNAIWLYWISVVFFVFNIVLFVTFTCISIIRYMMYPEIWGAMVRHPTQSLFLGTFPMGFATIVNMVVFVCVPSWGPRAITFAWSLLWIDAIISVAVCFYLPFVMCVILFGLHLSFHTILYNRPQKLTYLLIACDFMLKLHYQP